MLNRLFKRNVHVLPIDNGLFGESYITLNVTPLQLFFDNWRRYGLRIAWSNFREVMSK